MLRRVPLVLVLTILAMIASVLYGQVYSVTVIMKGLLHTLWVTIAIFLSYGFLLRWLRVTKRRLRFEQLIAQRRPQAEGETAVAAKAVTEEKAPELGEITSETEQLVKMLMITVAAGAFLIIWGPLLPALEVFERFSLWTSTTMVEGEPVTYEITLASIVTVIVVIALTLFAVQRIPGVVEIILRSRTQMSAGARYTSSTLLNYIIVGTGIVFGLSTLGLQWSQLQWLVAALGVGIGFGLQEIVANFICGLIILFERPIRVGDIVTVGGKDGLVTKIRIRATTIKDWDGKELLVPNKEFITTHLLNWTLSDPHNRIFIAIGVAYGTDVELAIKILLDIMNDHEEVLQDPNPTVVFENFGDNSLELSARCFLGVMERRLAVMTELRIAVTKAFEQAGIVIAFPQRDVHLDVTGPIEVKTDFPRNPDRPEPEPSPTTSATAESVTAEQPANEKQAERNRDVQAT